MKQNRKHSNRRFFLSAITIAAAGILIFFWSKTERKTDQFTETTDFSEKISTETALKDKDQTTESTKENIESETQLITETYSEQKINRIRSLPAGELAAAETLAAEQINPLFFASAVDDAVSARINGFSYTENPNIQLSDLSYLKMLYYGFDGNTYVGEMIVNRKIESDVLQIFKTLYENQYPIEKMVLIDDYNADDLLSMEDNNTSAFNYRTISGSDKLSNHSYGMAIDLNPKYNPYVKTASDGSVLCQPEGGREYADRSKNFAHKIDENDLAYRLFTEAGFTWGGSWNSVKDYQHFEKEDAGR